MKNNCANNIEKNDRIIYNKIDVSCSFETDIDMNVDIIEQINLYIREGLHQYGKNRNKR